MRKEAGPLRSRSKDAIPNDGDIGAEGNQRSAAQLPIPVGGGRRRRKKHQKVKKDGSPAPIGENK